MEDAGEAGPSTTRAEEPGRDAAEASTSHAVEGVAAATADDVAVPIVETVPEGAQGTTAFFLFSNVHRDAVKQALQAGAPEGEKVSVGTVAKQIGAMWKRCSDDVKAGYAAAAKANKEQSGTGGKEAGTSAPKDAPALPNAAVKRIIMLDADQTRLSAGAVSVCAKAAELFLEALAGKAHAEATGAARGTIAFRDVESVLGRWKPTGWTASPFREIENTTSTQKDGPSNAKALQEAAKGTRSISSFFARPQEDVAMPDED